MTIETISADEYHSSAGLSASIAKILLSSTPRHAWLAHPAINPNYVREDNKKFDTGTSAHDLLLEGGTGKIVAINPEDYPAKNGNIPNGWTNDAIRQARDDAYSFGQTPILKSEYAVVERMAAVARKRISDEPMLCGITLADGKPEQSIRWREKGVDCRARLDWLSNDYNLRIDYKTTSAKTPQEWMRKYLTSMGHDLQDDFHSRGVFATTGIRPRSLFLVQQDFGEFDCFFIELSTTRKEIARLKVEKAMAIWKSCIEHNEFPGWPTGIIEAEAAAWELAEAEEIDAEVKLWDKDAVGARENFLFGRVPDGEGWK